MLLDPIPCILQGCEHCKRRTHLVPEYKRVINHFVIFTKCHIRGLTSQWREKTPDTKPMSRDLTRNQCIAMMRGPTWLVVRLSELSFCHFYKVPHPRFSSNDEKRRLTRNQYQEIWRTGNQCTAMMRGRTWLVVRLLIVPKNSGASPVAPASRIIMIFMF